MAKEIRKVTPGKIITVDLAADADLFENATALYNHTTSVDLIGLIVDDRSISIDSINKLQQPYYFSSINARTYLSSDIRKSVNTFIADWRDQHQWQYQTFNGLMDTEGNKTNEYFILKSLWSHHKVIWEPLPQIHVLKPAATTFPGSTLLYNALIRKNDRWLLATDDDKELSFSWLLVRTDKYGNAIYSKPVGAGRQLFLTVPPLPHRHEIHLKAIKNGQVIHSSTSLNTSLH